MRNRLIHGYFGVDLAVVWDTAVRFVPPLVADSTGCWRNWGGKPVGRGGFEIFLYQGRGVRGETPGG